MRILTTLLRQYFPKSMELQDVAVDKVLKVVNSSSLGNVGWKTPDQVFE